MDIQGFMKKSERWTPPDPQTVSMFAADNHEPDHGRDGSIHTTGNANYTDLIPQYLDSLSNLSGVPRNLAPVSAHSTFYSFCLMSEILARGKCGWIHVCYCHRRRPEPLTKL